MTKQTIVQGLYIILLNIKESNMLPATYDGTFDGKVISCIFVLRHVINRKSQEADVILP